MTINKETFERISTYISEIEKDPEKHATLTKPQKNKDHLTLSMCIFSETLTNLISELYKSGCIINFDWPSWQNEAQKYLEDSSRLKNADLLTTCKILTTHIRKERFCEGHLSVMINNGHFIAVLKHFIKLISDEKEK